MVHDYVSSELPWMTDGAGLPPHADEHLPELVLTVFSVKFSRLASWNPDGGLSICFLLSFAFSNCIFLPFFPSILCQKRMLSVFTPWHRKGFTGEQKLYTQRYLSVYFLN